MKMREAINCYKKHGGHFFDNDAMSFWGSKVESKTVDEYGLFITSENDFYGKERYYNIRQFSKDYKNIRTIGEFNSYKTLEEAKSVAEYEINLMRLLKDKYNKY